MSAKFKTFLKEDGGASMAEYAILLAVITGALITILGAYTTSIANIFDFIRHQLEAAHQAAAS